MKEVLSKTADPNASLRDQEFFELSILEEPNPSGTRYCVHQMHGEWDEKDRQVMWDQDEADYYWALAKAKKRYADRRAALVEKGFTYSDMDAIQSPENLRRST